MYVCIYVCMYVYMYTCIHACTHVCIYVCVYVYVCMHVCMYMYVCVYVHRPYVCIYVCKGARFILRGKIVRTRCYGSSDRSYMVNHLPISRSSQCSRSGVTKAVVCVIVSVG